MSDIRPPITAGPIARAFKFLKSTSVSRGTVGGGDEVPTDAGGVVPADGAVWEETLSGEALGDVFGSAGRRRSSCADRRPATQIESNKARQTASETVIEA